MIGFKTDAVANPWWNLPYAAPYVLPEDSDAIAAYNSAVIDKFKVRLEILPEPFLGRTDAPLMVLGLNPGFKEINLSQHRNSTFATRSRENLLHQAAEYPFYLLDPSIERTNYWERKLRRLIETVGSLSVARNVACVEYFPYHSRRFKHSKLRLSSQNYSFSLVQAIIRGAVILILRGRRLWFNALPGLENYKNWYVPNSVQNPAVSERNFPIGFQVAINSLRRTAS